MTRKHGIRAPRIPPKEDPAVTIANQAKQVMVLIDRCEELNTALLKERAECTSYHCETISLHSQIAALNDAYTRLQGWQDCAREMLGTRLDSTAPGA